MKLFDFLESKVDFLRDLAQNTLCFAYYDVELGDFDHAYHASYHDDKRSIFQCLLWIPGLFLTAAFKLISEFISRSYYVVTQRDSKSFLAFLSLLLLALEALFVLSFYLGVSLFRLAKELIIDNIKTGIQFLKASVGHPIPYDQNDLAETKDPSESFPHSLSTRTPFYLPNNHKAIHATKNATDNPIDDLESSPHHRL